jgi:16S rRNA C1402 (ribose-2'-O) methylase RsmI
MFEEFIRGDLKSVLEQLEAKSSIKGEIVVVMKKDYKESKED